MQNQDSTKGDQLHRSWIGICFGRFLAANRRHHVAWCQQHQSPVKFPARRWLQSLIGLVLILQVEGLPWVRRGVTEVLEQATPPYPHHRPERGKLLKTPNDAKDLYNAYKEIERDYQQKAFKAKNWKLLNKQQGVEVSILQHPSDPTCPYVRMSATFPLTVEECWNFLRVSEWDRTMPKMDPFYEGVSVHGEYHHNAVHMILCRKRTKRILAFGKRDLVFLSVTDKPLPDGTWVSGTVSVRTDRIPRQTGYTRAFQDSIAFYKPINDNKHTILTIICRIDLNDSGENGTGGAIPMWLYVKTIGHTGATSVVRMRDALIEEKKQRDHILQKDLPWWRRQLLQL